MNIAVYLVLVVRESTANVHHHLIDYLVDAVDIVQLEALINLLKDVHLLLLLGTRRRLLSLFSRLLVAVIVDLDEIKFELVHRHHLRLFGMIVN